MKLTGSSRLSGCGSRSGNAFPSSDNRHQRIDFRSPQADWGSSALFSWLPFPNRRSFTRRDLSWRNTAKCLAAWSCAFARVLGSNYYRLSRITAIQCLRLGGFRSQATPDDNIFLECADAARADYPVTGNQKHFPKFWKKTEIITPWEFIGLIAPHRIK